MSFFKLVVTVLLKIYPTGNIFGKISVKAIRDTAFFQYIVCDQGTEGEPGVIFNRREKFKLFILLGDPLRQFPLLVWYPNLSIRKLMKSGWSAYCNDFEKSEWESFQSKTFSACKLKDEKEVVNDFIAFNLLKIMHPL